MVLHYAIDYTGFARFISGFYEYIKQYGKIRLQKH